MTPGQKAFETYCAAMLESTRPDVPKGSRDVMTELLGSLGWSDLHPSVRHAWEAAADAAFRFMMTPEGMVATLGPLFQDAGGE